MKTAAQVVTLHKGAARNASIAGAAGIDSGGTPLPLLQALAEVEDLRRKLASSQQECFTAHQRFERLANVNVQLREFIGWRASGAALGSPVHEPHRKFTSPFLFAGLDANATGHIDRLLANRSRYRKGAVIYFAGGPFKSLYAICTGSCKTVLPTKDGQDQVAGYHLAGEIIGLDGVGTDTHECQGIALEDAEVCPLPFDQLENLARFSERFGHVLHVLLSLESTRARTLMTIVGTMRAEQRVAVFLLDLSRRYGEQGYSSCEFVLRLTRQEIGSHLGLKLETISRVFSRLQREGLIQVEGRAVKLLDRTALSRIADSGA